MFEKLAQRRILLIKFLANYFVLIFFFFFFFKLNNLSIIEVTVFQMMAKYDHV